MHVGFNNPPPPYSEPSRCTEHIETLIYLRLMGSQMFYLIIGMGNRSGPACYSEEEGMFCFNCAPYRMNHISSAGWQPLNRNECPFIVGIYHCLKRGGEIESRDLVNVFSPRPSQKAHCTIAHLT